MVLLNINLLSHQLHLVVDCLCLIPDFPFHQWANRFDKNLVLAIELLVDIRNDCICYEAVGAGVVRGVLLHYWDLLGRNALIWLEYRGAGFRLENVVVDGLVIRFAEGVEQRG